jgi:hypothetical protein
MGLRVATEERARFDDIRPLRKSLAPPFVVLVNGMKLWEIQRQDLQCDPPLLPATETRSDSDGPATTREDAAQSRATNRMVERSTDTTSIVGPLPMKDPKKLFNARLDSSNVRAIDFHEGEKLPKDLLSWLGHPSGRSRQARSWQFRGPYRCESRGQPYSRRRGASSHRFQSNEGPPCVGGPLRSSTLTAQRTADRKACGGLSNYYRKQSRSLISECRSDQAKTRPNSWLNQREGRRWSRRIDAERTDVVAGLSC